MADPKYWSREHHKKALEELRPGSKPDPDPAALEIVKESVKRAFGFDWPEGVTFEEACRLLAAERVRYWNDRLRRVDKL